MTESKASDATQAWCAERGHPYVTYHPWLDRTYCRCGERQEAGERPLDWKAMWEVFHDHAPGEPCRCYLS